MLQPLWNNTFILFLIITVLLLCSVSFEHLMAPITAPKVATFKLAPLLRTAISSRFGANIYPNVRRPVRRQIPEIYNTRL